VILRGRINCEAIQKGFPTSARVLSTLSDSLKTMPEELVSLYLWKQREKKGMQKE
jgi:hypothetical protein